MNPPSAQQIERIQRLLVSEGAHEAATGYPTAAARVYDKLHAHLAPLLGSAGVEALFVRSAKLTRGDVICLADPSTLESSAKLRECLLAQPPEAARQAAFALFSTFFALITTFIGERLTTQALRRAWPTIDERAPEETKS